MPITPQTESAQLVLGHMDALIPILSCLDDTEVIARASAVSRSEYCDSEAPPQRPVD